MPTCCSYLIQSARQLSRRDSTCLGFYEHFWISRFREELHSDLGTYGSTGCFNTFCKKLLQLLKGELNYKRAHTPQQLEFLIKFGPICLNHQLSTYLSQQLQPPFLQHLSTSCLFYLLLLCCLRDSSRRILQQQRVTT